MNLLKLLKKRVVLFDGGMGTALSDLQAQCSEELSLTHPDFISRVHQSFIDVGSDVITANTFNANRISLHEHGLEDQVRQMNIKAVEIAKRAVKASGRDVLISGDIGPTTKLPTLAQVTYDEMYAAYYEQIRILVEAGVDQIHIETCQDILQAKIPVAACNEIFKKQLRRLPIIVTVTVDSSGKMLLGTEPDAVLATLIPLGVDVVGLNCGVGPEGMKEAARYFADHSPVPILIQPNAGLPEIVAGKSNYNLSAEDFAKWMKHYVGELGIEMVGGCCGTMPVHISKVHGVLGKTRSKRRRPDWKPSLSSLFNASALRQNPAPTIIGERMNINGSKKFRKAMLANDYNAASVLATDQEETGAHVLDISVAYAGRDEIHDFEEIIRKVIVRSRLPIAIDSTNVDAIEAALKLTPGRPIINSINLEDGGLKAKKVLALARKYSAAIIALTIDERGMAKDVAKKREIAARLIKLCKEYEIEESDIYIDPLTFTLAEPRAATFGSGAKTLEAIKKIKKKHPKANIVLGVSNISYGFDRKARKILNSIFLHEAIKAGLDGAIIHASQIVPLTKIDDETQKIAQDLIWNRRGNALEAFLSYFQYRDISFEEEVKSLSPAEGARVSILRGDKTRIAGYLKELIKTMGPKSILDEILLPAMAEVGKLFDNGKIPLPFVLQSAEVMKEATDKLASKFDSQKGISKGKVLLATVKGDVHDIGKNLVDIVLSNNGFKVLNIGVKQTVENIYKVITDHNVDVIGLSGLLVESALIMKGDLAELARRGITTPIVCGGAALTRKYVEEELGAAYKGQVFYAKDAFDGLKIVEEILNKENENSF
jgi:5-methyltetrahydrofolate--homocysteine methyltransferase